MNRALPIRLAPPGKKTDSRGDGVHPFLCVLKEVKPKTGFDQHEKNLKKLISFRAYGAHIKLNAFQVNVFFDGDAGQLAQSIALSALLHIEPGGW